MSASAQERPATRWLWMIVGAALGSAITWLFEPRAGRRHRALVRDKGTHYFKDLRWQGEKKARNLRNRVRGLPHRVNKTRALSAAPDDTVLVERVRSMMGRKVSHPKAVKVEADQGVVTLSGQIIAREIEDLIRTVQRVPGVLRVVNNVYAHKSSRHVPSLQS